MNEYLFHLFFIFYSIFIYKYRIKIANSLKLIDFPDNLRKSHSNPVPCIGGIILYPYIISSIFFIFFLSLIKFKILLLWIFLFSSFFFKGLIDDRINLNAKTKTFILIFILFIILPLDKSLIIQSINFKNLNMTIILNEGSLFFTIFCIYFFYNSLNFSDGYNGISITLTLYILFVIFVARNELNLFHASCILGLILILIPNLFGKLFIGNSGVSLLSIILSVLLIESYNKGYILFDEIILIVFLPTIDAARITIERIINGKSPFESDKNHFHHILTNITKKEIVFLPYLIFATLPYLITKLNIPSYISLITFTCLYFVALFIINKLNA